MPNGSMKPERKTRPAKPLEPANTEGAEEPQQGELFVCEIGNWPVKDDLASMEIPLFSLSKNRDVETRLFKRGNKSIRIIPSMVGCATVFDKDLLLYIASQIVEARNQGLPVSRRVCVSSYDFLVATERGDGNANFVRVVDMLRRLRGTTIETNIKTGGITQMKGFSLIDNYEITHETKDKKGALEFTVMISEWLMNGLLNYEVLTLDRGYFRLTSSIERRLYEIARKHCGDQPFWKCNIDLLMEKLGTKYSRAKLRAELRSVIQDDHLPEYRVALDSNRKPDDVVFCTRDSAKLSKALVDGELYTWFSSLERAQPK